MKFHCECGHTIVDAESHWAKGHLIADEDYFSLLDAIDEAVESGGATAKEKEATCMKVRSLHSKTMRSAWQCDACARLYIDMPDGTLRCFVPSDPSTASGAFASRLRRSSRDEP